MLAALFNLRDVLCCSRSVFLFSPSFSLFLSPSAAPLALLLPPPASAKENASDTETPGEKMCTPQLDREHLNVFLWFFSMCVF